MSRLVKMFIFRSWQVGAALSHAGKSVFSLTDPYCHLSSTILQLSFIVSSCDSYATKEIPFLLLPHWLFFSAYHSWLQLLLRRINISICKAWITLALHLNFFWTICTDINPIFSSLTWKATNHSTNQSWNHISSYTLPLTVDTIHTYTNCVRDKFMCHGNEISHEYKAAASEWGKKSHLNKAL